MGIVSPLTATLSLSLGSSDVTLKEMTSAFGCLANSGIKTVPYSIVKVVDNKGRVLEEYSPEEKDAISVQTAFLMTNLLRGVVEHGTGIYAKQLKRPAAGKTGTTNDCQDAWFIGYTPQLVCGVWVGYDDHRTLGKKMTGGRLACPIWTDFMRAALRKQPVIDFTAPANITFVKIDPQTGLLALGNPKGTYLEAFLSGTEPKEFSLGKGIAVVKKLEDETATQVSTGIENAPGVLTGLIEGTTRAVPVLPSIGIDTEGGF
jgi:penicillin-binding protein 1A